MITQPSKISRAPIPAEAVREVVLAEQLRQALFSLKSIADGVANPAKYAAFAHNHITSELPQEPAPNHVLTDWSLSVNEYDGKVQLNITTPYGCTANLAVEAEFQPGLESVSAKVLRDLAKAL